jgi:hypothetical protein
MTTSLFEQRKAQSQSTKKSCFLFHKWGKWQIIDEGPILRQYHRDPRAHSVGRYIEQKRVCECCGKVQLDMQKTEL